MTKLSSIFSSTANAAVPGSAETTDLGASPTDGGWRRRELLGAGLAVTTVLSSAAGMVNLAQAAEVEPGRLELPPLPYALDALAPVLSSETMGTHYGKHHAGYYANLTKLVTGRAYASMQLPDIVRESAKAGDLPVYNNAAQAWNHTFLWHSMRPKGGGRPPQALREAIETSWPSVDAFNGELAKQATGLFGSGWLWVVLNTSERKVMLLPAPNAQTPITTAGLVPLSVVDVWEHAYYIDYRNRRADYVAALLASVIDWGMAEQRLLAVASQSGDPSRRHAD